MPKIFNREENAVYHTEVAKLAVAQIELETEKIKKSQSELALIKARVFFWIAVGVTITTFVVGLTSVATIIWSALK